MTVHSAKGLEFPIVFVAALHKGIDTNLPVVAFSPRIGLGARWRMPGTRDEKDDLFQHAIRAERKQREMEESHRLLYVAMTRAEQHLALSFSGQRPGNWAKVVAGRLAALARRHAGRGVGAAGAGRQGVDAARDGGGSRDGRGSAGRGSGGATRGGVGGAAGCDRAVRFGRDGDGLWAFLRDVRGSIG